VVADVRLDPHLGVDEAVRADHELLKSVETNAGQSHEHTRVVQVVCFQVKGARVVFDECVTVGDGIITTTEFGSATLWEAMHTNIFPCTFRTGWPHAVVTSTSGRARPIASTAANECPRRLSPTPWRADEVGFLGIRRRWSLRPIEGPASASVWPNDVFSKITPRKSPRFAGTSG
jgi:hypothetical protein